MSICEELAEKEKDTIKRLIDLSERMGVEIGNYVCRDEELKLGGMCTGTACSVAIEDCEEGEAIGYFHTHPAIEAEHQKYPSREDILYAIQRGLGFVCVGYREDGKDKILCFCPPRGAREQLLLHGAYEGTEKKFREANEEITKFIGEVEAYEKKLREYEELEEKCREAPGPECEALSQTYAYLAKWYEELEEKRRELEELREKVHSEIAERTREALAKYGKCFCEGEVHG